MVGRWFLQVIDGVAHGRQTRKIAARTYAACRWLVLLLVPLCPAVAATDARSCAACHQEEYAQWQHSHHAKAMQEATDQTVLAQFDGSATAFGEYDFRFLKQGEHFRVSIQKQGSDKPPQIFDIPYTFGYTPLQQYLARLPQGKFQALPVVWDTRPKAEGGQRWYALESDLNWDHPGFTWNTSCADCHSTALQKNYEVATQRFNTTWDEINVACVSCHGGADAHLRWLQTDQPEEQKNAGFPVSLAERGQWRWLENEAIARRNDPPEGEQLSTCAQCHSRRERIGEWHPGTALLDHSVPAMISSPQYFADGQIRDEVFVLGSFMQSRMHAAGVVCSNCHEPHSLKLRAEGDALCNQCHLKDAYSGPDHHGHSPQTAGCVDCHMPATVYMGVDPRRDHRFGIPDPVLSAALGSPDPCSDCHEDAAAEELASAIDSFGGSFGEKSGERVSSTELTQIFAEAAIGVPGNSLRYRLDGEAFSPIRQAAILVAINANADAGLRAIVDNKLRHADPMVRLAAVRSLAAIPLEQRWASLSPLIDDPVRAVRFETAATLAQAISLPLPPESRAALAGLLGRYESYLQSNLDSPTLASNLGNFYAAQNEREQAEAAYRQAIALDRDFIYPYLQLAELARGAGQTGSAPGRSEKDWLDAAMEIAHTTANAGELAELHYRYGLYWVRAGDYPAALAALLKAHTKEPAVESYATTYAIALESTGQPEEAMAALAAYYRRNPLASRAADLLVRYSLKYGKQERARNTIMQWLAHEPNNPQAQRWWQYLQQRR